MMSGQPVAPPVDPHRRKSRPWLIVVMIVVGVGVVCCATPVLVVRGLIRSAALPKHELGWIDDERKTLPAFEVEIPADNGYDKYEEASRLVEASVGHSGQRNQLSWLHASRTGDDKVATELEPDTREYLALIEPALELARDAQSMDCVSPHDAILWEFPQTGADLRAPARAAVTEAHMLFVDGNVQGALERLEGIHRSANNLANLAPLDTRDAAVSVSAMASEESLFIIGAHEATRDELVEHAEAARELRLAIPSLGASIGREAEPGREMLRDLKTDGLSAIEGKSYGPKAGELPDALKSVSRGLVRDMASMSLEWQDDRLARLIEEADKPPAQSQYRTLIARTETDVRERNDLLSISLDALLYRDDIYNGNLRWRAELFAIETVAMIEVYAIDHRQYPESLSDLQPEYMPELPFDPWDGGEMRYARTDDGYTLYSVGEDMVDDGGVMTDYRRPDWVIAPLEFEAPTDPADAFAAAAGP